YPQLEAPISRLLAAQRHEAATATVPTPMRPSVAPGGGPLGQRMAIAGRAPPSMPSVVARNDAAMPSPPAPRPTWTKAPINALVGRWPQTAGGRAISCALQAMEEWGRYNAPERRIRPTESPASAELPFVLKLSMAGSGNTLWRTRKWSDKWPQEK